MLGILSFSLAHLGFLVLALAMPRHAAQLRRAAFTAPVRQILRGAGWAVLALSVWPAVALWGLAIGITAWCGLLTCAALSLGQSLSLIEAGWPRPLVLLPAALGLAVTGLAGLTV